VTRTKFFEATELGALPGISLPLARVEWKSARQFHPSFTPPLVAHRGLGPFLGEIL
jgi:hypothetical protein